MPLKTPLGASVMPVGRLVGVVDHVYGDCPPDAVSDCEYACPTFALGKLEGVVMLRETEADETVMEVKATAAAALESETCK